MEERIQSVYFNRDQTLFQNRMEIDGTALIGMLIAILGALGLMVSIFWNEKNLIRKAKEEIEAKSCASDASDRSDRKAVVTRCEPGLYLTSEVARHWQTIDSRGNAKYMRSRTYFYLQVDGRIAKFPLFLPTTWRIEGEVVVAFASEIPFRLRIMLHNAAGDGCQIWKYKTICRDWSP